MFTYDLAVQFYQQAGHLPFPRHLKEQFDRAASSIVLNLAEGYGRRGLADQRQYFSIALGSARECEAILDLNPDSDAIALLDRIAASIYCLIRNVRGHTP